jgi:hypothetical protein
MRGQQERQRRIGRALAVHPGGTDRRVQSRRRGPQPLPATFVAEATEYLESPDRIAEQHELGQRLHPSVAADLRTRLEAREAQRVRSTLRLFAEVAAHGSRLAQCGRRPRGSRQGARRVTGARRTAAGSSDDGSGGSDADGPPDGLEVGTRGAADVPRGWRA